MPLQELNSNNGADKLTHEIAERCLTEFKGKLYGVEKGCPYGAALAFIGELWRGRGTIWGFDTFEGHPQEIAELCPDTIKDKGVDSNAARCMDYWYNSPDYGTDKLKYEYIRSKLDELGLDNAILVKGLFTSETKIDFIPKLHYAMIDFDYPLSQWDGYNAVKNKIVKGGYLCLHDMIPKGHIAGNYERYQDILAEGIFDIELEDRASLLVILKKK